MKIIELIFLIFSMFLFYSCVPVELQEYKESNDTVYKLHKNINNLEIYIDTFDDKDRVKTIFGVDLLSKNIIPVFITAKNNNDYISFTILKEKISLKKQNKSIHQIKNLSDTDSSSGDSMAVAGLALLSMPLMFAGGHAMANDSAVKSNIISNEFRKKTLSPRKNQSGFVYFNIEDNQHLTISYTLYIEAINSEDRSIITFKFPIKMEPKK